LGYVNGISLAENTKKAYIGVLVNELTEFKSVFLRIRFISTKINHMLNEASTNKDISGVRSPGVTICPKISTMTKSILMLPVSRNYCSYSSIDIVRVI